MIERTIKVKLSDGLESRPAALFVQVASKFNSRIYIMLDNKKVNAKSIMGMMTLGLSAGEQVTVTADGTDEKEAMDNIEKYLSSEN